ncbi:AI-2E family transporter [Desulfovibrio aerotolerans]|uniref:AI-2E family transporter n=1 Tax=Solidesulfovibrio aerotolerans TaxID=295255 RepID=A0A7C9MTM9_9BACT|nr:AI-2E family transporter [Solidesulfovibrio aerotolerans]MYL81954.1 AI-2E family transporter [Solidesulfovibrio aerotolerans]
MQPVRPKASVYDVVAWIGAGLALLLVFPLHLFPALMAGLLVFELVQLAAPVLPAAWVGHRRAKQVVVACLAVLIVVGLALLAWKGIAFFHSESTSIPTLLRKMAEALESLRARLPGWLVTFLPENVEAMSTDVVAALRARAATMQAAGKGIAQLLAHVLVGLILGAVIALVAETTGEKHRPLAAALLERASRLCTAFRAVVFAQVRISGLNTALTVLYLFVVLPALGVHLPLAKTMVALTFLAGMLPVVGNLISNSAIVVVSLSVSFAVAGWSLLFLILVHKLEYFLNARIVGGHIHARTWEILLAMLVMEAAFGLAGLVAAPIYYAYLKKELSDQGLV